MPTILEALATFEVAYTLDGGTVRLENGVVLDPHLAFNDLDMFFRLIAGKYIEGYSAGAATAPAFTDKPYTTVSSHLGSPPDFIRARCVNDNRRLHNSLALRLDLVRKPLEVAESGPAAPSARTGASKIRARPRNDRRAQFWDEWKHLTTLPMSSASTPEHEYEKMAFRAALNAAMHTLTPKEERTLRMRYGIGVEAMTLDAIGGQFGVSKERVRQIEQKALRKFMHPSRRNLVAPLLKVLANG